MIGTLTPGEESQLLQTIEMFEVITQSQPQDYQSLEILKEAYSKLGRDKEAVNTAKRIAEAYMQLGQLSSAILEYETILQRYPDDPDVRRALSEIENKATSLTESSSLPEPEVEESQSASGLHKNQEAGHAAPIDDGRQAMHKMFVDGKIITEGDFDLCWPSLSLRGSVGKPVEPFIQVLADKNITQLEVSLKAITDKTRMGYLPLERYDIDAELVRSFPRDICLRWCVLPFDKMSKSILVATANPYNQQAIKEIADATKSRILWYLAPPPDIIKALKKFFR